MLSIFSFTKKNFFSFLFFLFPFAIFNGKIFVLINGLKDFDTIFRVLLRTECGDYCGRLKFCPHLTNHWHQNIQFIRGYASVSLSKTIRRISFPFEIENPLKQKRKVSFLIFYDRIIELN